MSTTQATESRPRRRHHKQTRYTLLISARVPIATADRLREHVARTGSTVTDVVTQAITEYLTHHSPTEAGGKEDGESA